MKTSFDKLAFCYDFLASIFFGKNIRLSQTYFLDRIKDRSVVLVIGGGTGWIIPEILNASGISELDYIESSHEMMEKSLKRSDDGRIHYILGNENDLPSSEKYDIVLTPYFLDLFNEAELNVVIDKIYHSLKVNGKWIVADFHLLEDSSWYQKALIEAMYLFFSVTCNIKAKKLTPPDKLFLSRNMICEGSHWFLNGLIKSSIWQKW